MPPFNTGFVIFPDLTQLDFTGPLQVLSRLPQSATHIVAKSAAPVPSDCGLGLVPTCTFADCPPLDLMCVPGGSEGVAGVINDRETIDFVRRQAANAKYVTSVCTGAFVLGVAGLLKGRRATTHWEDCTRLQADFPEVDMRADSIFEEDRGVWTSAGVTAGIDMALAMVEQDLGRTEALRLARSLVLYVKRTGGQRQFSAALRQQVKSGSGRFDALVTEIRADLAADLSVPRLAAMAHMSERNFSRLFTRVVGASPAQFVEDMRVDAACDAIERAEASVSEAPFLFGFGNAERMRRAFQRRKGIAPSDYAARFGAR